MYKSDIKEKTAMQLWSDSKDQYNSFFENTTCKIDVHYNKRNIEDNADILLKVITINYSSILLRQRSEVSVHIQEYKIQQHTLICMWSWQNCAVLLFNFIYISRYFVYHTAYFIHLHITKQYGSSECQPIILKAPFLFTTQHMIWSYYYHTSRPLLP